MAMSSAPTKIEKVSPALARILSTQERNVEYLWKVNKDELKRLKKTRVPINSPSFFGGADDCLEWQIVMRIGRETPSVNVNLNNYGREESRHDRVQVFVTLVSMRSQNDVQQDKTIAVRCEFDIDLGERQKKIGEVMEKPERISVGDQLGINSVCKSDFDGYFSWRGDYNCTMKVKCALWIYDLRKSTSDVLEDYVATRQFQSLKNVMASVLTDSSSADITLKVGKEVYPAHTCILSARSKVFAAMFASNMKEARKRTVVITDFAPETVQAMLKYIYCGDISAPKDSPIDLLNIADKYELLELKDECEKLIVPSLTVANAVEAFICAYQHNLMTLMPEIMSFFSRNLEAIAKTDSFKEVSRRYPIINFALHSK